MSGDFQKEAWDFLYSSHNRMWRGGADLSWIPIPKNARILDAGCGNGKSSRTLIDSGCSVVGVDFSEKAIEYCREHLGERAEFVVSDLRELPFKDASFDAVLAIHVLGHMHEEDSSKAACEILRVLKKGGVVCGESFAPGDLRARSSEDMRNGILYRYMDEDAAASLFPGCEPLVLETVSKPTKFGGDRVRVRFAFKKL